MASFEQLPVEIYQMVCQYANALDVLSLRYTCRRFTTIGSGIAEDRLTETYTRLVFDPWNTLPRKHRTWNYGEEPSLVEFVNQLAVCPKLAEYPKSLVCLVDPEHASSGGPCAAIRTGPCLYNIPRRWDASEFQERPLLYDGNSREYLEDVIYRKYCIYNNHQFMTKKIYLSKHSNAFFILSLILPNLIHIGTSEERIYSGDDRPLWRALRQVKYHVVAPNKISSEPPLSKIRRLDFNIFPPSTVWCPIPSTVDSIGLWQGFSYRYDCSVSDIALDQLTYTAALPGPRKYLRRWEFYGRIDFGFTHSLDWLAYCFSRQPGMETVVCELAAPSLADWAKLCRYTIDLWRYYQPQRVRFGYNRVISPGQLPWQSEISEHLPKLYLDDSCMYLKLLDVDATILLALWGRDLVYRLPMGLQVLKAKNLFLQAAEQVFHDNFVLQMIHRKRKFRKIIISTDDEGVQRHMQQVCQALEVTLVTLSLSDKWIAADEQIST